MRITYFVLLVFITGCVSGGVVPVEARVTFDEELVERLLDVGPPVAAVSGVSGCAEAYQLAERSLLERMPAFDSIEVNRRLVEKHRPFGVYLEDSKKCVVFDIIDIDHPNQYLSPHERAEEHLEKGGSRYGYYATYGYVGQNKYKPFVTIEDCPLCL